MSKELVQRQFGANAAAYLTSTVHAKGASLARLVELVGPKSSWVALDVATGAGHTAAQFAPHVARVVASDLTPEMLAQVRKLAAEKGLANMETTIADAEAMPFPDQHFDLVTCRIAPHHFSSIAMFLSEVRRVLKPGGVFALVDNVSPDEETTPGFSSAELRDAAIAYNAFEKVRDPSHGRALPTAEWLELMSEVGLELVHREHAPKAMDFASWVKTMNVPAETVPQLAAMLDEASPALRAFLKPTNENGKRGFTLDELIAIARRPA
ncbi:MAG: methyltransferase domain-containing protein [Hyphomicrobiaceae bacterium]|nr:methyltransferase domain-containing protein [Hyphomicrobiaceae bacterium]